MRGRGCRGRWSAGRCRVAELAIHLERFAAPEPDALVFAGPDGGALRARQWRARHWAPAIAEARPAPLRPHDRPAPYRRRPLDRPGRQSQADRHLGRAHVRLRRARPLRASLPRARGDGDGAPRSGLHGPRETLQSRGAEASRSGLQPGMTARAIPVGGRGFEPLAPSASIVGPHTCSPAMGTLWIVRRRHCWRMTLASEESGASCG